MRWAGQAVSATSSLLLPNLLVVLNLFGCGRSLTLWGVGIALSLYVRLCIFQFICVYMLCILFTFTFESNNILWLAWRADRIRSQNVLSLCLTPWDLLEPPCLSPSLCLFFLSLFFSLFLSFSLYNTQRHVPGLSVAYVIAFSRLLTISVSSLGSSVYLQNRFCHSYWCIMHWHQWAYFHFNNTEIFF